MEGLGERERENVLNRLEHKKTNGLNPPPLSKSPWIHYKTRRISGNKSAA